MSGPLRSFKLASDVRVYRRGGYVYVCSSRSTLRMSADSLDLGVLGESEPNIGRSTRSGSEVVPLELLSSKATDELVRRGLAVPEATSPALEHVAVAAGCVPPADPASGVVEIAGPNGFSALVAHALRRCGVQVRHGRRRLPREDLGAVVLSLAEPEEELREWTRVAIVGKFPMIAHLCSPTRLLLAVLRPPTTACPLCLVTRLRATFGWQEIADLPFGALFGEVLDTTWPSTGAAAALVAEAVLRSAAGDQSLPDAALHELNLRELTSSRHAVLHTPNCAGCGGSLAGAERPLGRWNDAVTAPSLEECYARMERAVDPLTGIVADVVAMDKHESAGGLTHAITTGHVSTRWFSEVGAQALGGAVKSDPQEALVCALGEAMERYACGIYRRDDLTRATLRELGEEAVDPRSLPLGSTNEYEQAAGRVHPYTDDLEIDWVKGISLASGRTRYVPACAVYVPYRFSRRQEILLRPISTGLAAGPTVAAAIRSGLLEAIERDSLVIYWENRLESPTLDLDTLPAGPAREIVDRLRRAGVELTCKDTTTDVGVPSVLLSSRQRTSDGPLVAHASRAAMSYVQCIQAALEELEQSRESIRDWTAARGVPAADATLRTIEDFFSYYCAEERLPMLDFLYAGESKPVDQARRDPGGAASDVEELVARLGNVGLEPIAVDITPIDVSECGVRVIKSLVPGLQPVAFNRDFRHLGGTRLYMAPVRMGARARPLTEQQLNPNPVPGG